MGPGDLARALCGLALRSHPDLIVGLERADDAGVIRLSDEIALVQTLDFFTPIVDDPYTFGQIAAANALSDVYAMGGRPLCAMNIVCFPSRKLDISVLQAVLRGGLDVIHRAGAVLVGGHSIDDPELKYGLSVSGVVHPERVLDMRGALPGDALVLTKPLGTGIGGTAVKAGLAGEGLLAEMSASMIALNREAAEALEGLGVHACTDVTGFGLLGHACELVERSEVGMAIRAERVPIFGGLEALAAKGLLPGGLHRNRAFRAGMVDMDPAVPEPVQAILYDPQTSGGLLAALAPGEAEQLLERLHSRGIAAAAIIGEVVDSPAGRVVVR
ncbi:MAG: selenide, water dikinase SelD [Deltaproteobacteria bacterium]|nr:selenide, water dikinase SelD [Deltaproteobacteria bacterium]